MIANIFASGINRHGIREQRHVEAVFSMHGGIPTLDIFVRWGTDADQVTVHRVDIDALAAIQECCGEGIRRLRAKEQ